MVDTLNLPFMPQKPDLKAIYAMFVMAGFPEVSTTSHGLYILFLTCLSLTQDGANICKDAILCSF